MFGEFTRYLLVSLGLGVSAAALYLWLLWKVWGWRDK